MTWITPSPERSEPDGNTEGNAGEDREDKATGDADFRARLLSDPKGALEQELSVTIPASLSVEVHEESGTSAHLVLPPDSRLSEGDLAVAGGGDWNITSDW